MAKVSFKTKYGNCIRISKEHKAIADAEAKLKKQTLKAWLEEAIEKHKTT